MGERAHRALLARQLAAMTDRELESEDPDDRVDHSARDEPGPREPLERRCLDEALAGALHGADPSTGS